MRAFLLVLGLMSLAAAARAGPADGPAVDTVTLAAIMGKIDSYYFMQLERHPVFPRSQVELGRKLFSDAGLSRDGTLSCATCHRADRSFEDGRPRAIGRGGRVLLRNTPGLSGVLNYKRFFWDGRAATLEDAIQTALGNPDEMNQDLPGLAARLGRDPAYRRAFKRAFGRERPDGGDILAALKAYVSFISFPKESVFDRFREDRELLSNSEQRGLLLFYGKANCVKCHSGPAFTDQSFHNIGLKPQTSDPGRYAVDAQTASLRAFRTPSLREVSNTAPYMHDGRFKSLAEVVDFYSRGGDVHAGQDPRIRRLDLSSQEKRDLVAFLSTLTSASPADIDAEPRGHLTCGADPKGSEAELRGVRRAPDSVFADIWRYYAYKAFAARDPSICREAVTEGTFLGREQTASFLCLEWYNEMRLAYHAVLSTDVERACFPAMHFNYHLTSPNARSACRIFADQSQSLAYRCGLLVPRFLSRENRVSCVDWLKQFSLDEAGCRALYDYGGDNSLLNRCLTFALFRRAHAASDPDICRSGPDGGSLCLLFMGRSKELAAGQLRDLHAELCGGGGKRQASFRKAARLARRRDGRGGG